MVADSLVLETPTCIAAKRAMAIEERNSAFKFTMAPNPARKSVRIEAGGSSGILMITDLAGRTVYSDTCNREAEIDVSQLKPAVYFVIFVSSEGKVAREKLAVE